jgi:hypothetical protein
LLQGLLLPLFEDGEGPGSPFCCFSHHLVLGDEQFTRLIFQQLGVEGNPSALPIHGRDESHDPIPLLESFP